MPEPLYTPTNCRIAYQLHWSLTLFVRQSWPNEEVWRHSLEQALEPDGIRILEFRNLQSETGQFFVSSKPDVAPAGIVRCVKGRLQYLVRAAVPKLWQRHYSITSVGDANNDVLQAYVGRQVQHHAMADSNAADRLSKTLFHDPEVDLSDVRSSGHARFTHSLHIVLENTDRLSDTNEERLAASRTMLIAACGKKGWRLSRLSFASNHLHMLVGCEIGEAPRDVALSLMNNLAFVHAMKPVCEHSFYVGTFGPYDHGAIRRRLPPGS